ncbi:unnamed protein product [Paramecium primaurelia]|uniref:Phosphoglycerate mutase n=1 Tax=Paramecium primaurelia TaxID=5886 RepID=A0A8S1LF29_PARPR|nr:unnamed protein product [Paramecium primaurelia]
MIFFVRHGERADQTNDNGERKRIQKSFDPHLTNVGDKQARMTGAHLNKLIQEYANEKQIQVKDLQINFMTSPFLRCIQTSINLMREIPNNSKLYIQDEIGELMYTFDFSSNILDKLHLRTEQHPILTKEYQNGVQIIKERFIKNPNLPQPVFPENDNLCYNRIKAFMVELKSQMDKLPNKTNTINICVTHQGVVELSLMIEKVKNHNWIDYCGVSQFILEDHGNVKIGIKGQSFWK